MGTIMTRKKKDGSQSFTAVIRKKQKGKVVLTLTETFQNQRSAQRWMKQRERELNAPNGLERVMAKTANKTWSDAIEDYIGAAREKFGKTKSANLTYLQRLDFGKLAVEETTDHDFFKLAQDLLRGVQACPSDKEKDCPEHYALKPRLPQTVQSYMATLSAVVTYGGTSSKVEMPIGEFHKAIASLKHHKLVKRSEKRTRRPTVEEMNRLLSHFHANYTADQRRVPMHKIVGAAITLAHRQADLCKLKWNDVDEGAMKLTLRDMKSPKGSAGNDKELWVTDEGMKIIQSMPHRKDRVFPYHSDTVSRLFTQACEILGIEDLRFHDLRHDAISRFFEMDLEGGTRDKILKFTGHTPDGSLSRYINIEHKSDKYKNWEWWPILFASL
ncbi:tyrosine-type recombinase/integrase [Actibacterium lipolyticum]|uniref:Phage integrase family protein n=1 Tax=Actibacterium lipolyticum TaxID=1524263 RepID=A0A238JW75_9RHOB|nr:tyrosine-type recombinase/integrase [Actibacterium lipolyticum]SMX34414.1 Phage integrase family protein [Actibacterium lipolyticum]